MSLARSLAAPRGILYVYPRTFFLSIAVDACFHRAESNRATRLALSR